MDELKKDTPKRRGRPPKNQQKNPIGRPRDPKQAMKAFRDRLLNSPKSRKVFDTILEAALDPEHKNQVAAWNLIFPRIAPQSLFEAEVDKGSSGSNAISVTIKTAGDTHVTMGNEDTLDTSETIEAEYTEVPKDV